jgi:hypothetical protein
MSSNMKMVFRTEILLIDIHTYHSRFIPEGVAEASQIFLRDAHVVLTKLLSFFFVAFYDIHGRKKEVLFFYFVPDTTRDSSQS